MRDSYDILRMNPDELNSSEELRQRSAYWFTRMHSGQATPEDIAACEAWRRQDPSHERMYRSIEFFWKASGQLPEKKLRAILAQPDDPQKTRRISRRQFGMGLAGLCAAAVVTAVAIPTWFSEQAQYRTVFLTQAERSEVTLPDGSTLSLNVNTRLEVAFYQGRRHIELLSGEAFFDVEPDAARPFSVQADHTTVEVTGTRFNVRRDPQDISVSVESGTVVVSSGSWWNHARQQLRAGQGMAIGVGEAASEVFAIRVENIVAWREGKIVFENAPLATVVDEMNRYLPQPAHLEAPQLRDYRVAGIFNVDNPNAMMDALPAIAPVRLYRLSDGRIRIVAR